MHVGFGQFPAWGHFLKVFCSMVKLFAGVHSHQFPCKNFELGTRKPGDSLRSWFSGSAPCFSESAKNFQAFMCVENSYQGWVCLCACSPPWLLFWPFAQNWRQGSKTFFAEMHMSLWPFLSSIKALKSEPFIYLKKTTKQNKKKRKRK